MSQFYRNIIQTNINKPGQYERGTGRDTRSPNKISSQQFRQILSYFRHFLKSVSKTEKVTTFFHF